MHRRITTAVLFLLLAPRVVAAQQDTARPPGNVRVFIDNCPCSLDYLRTEIPYVDYVRDRADADVHVLFTYQGTGAGGTSYTTYFIGLRAFAGSTDTLVFATQPTDTEDQTRQTLVRYVKMGLMRFVARTPAAERIRITVAPAAGAGAGSAAPIVDPWDYWVFRVGMGGGGSGEKSRSRVSTNGSISATRTTEAWKIRFSVSGRYEDAKLTIPGDTAPDGTKLPDEIINNYTHSANAGGFVVRSLGPHFSAGVTSSAATSSFSNQDLFFRIAPALEYSVFPYSESTRRLLTLNYSVGYNAYDYKEETIYFETAEQLPDHQLQVGYEVTQPWGNAFGSLSGQQYLHDTDLYSVSAFGFASIRLFKGFNLNFSASASTIYNQISIERGTASDVDVLLNRRQLVTPYRVSGNISISYTFGSIYNNIVNPRFNNASGGEIFFF